MDLFVLKPSVIRARTWILASTKIIVARASCFFLHAKIKIVPPPKYGCLSYAYALIESSPTSLSFNVQRKRKSTESKNEQRNVMQ